MTTGIVFTLNVVLLVTSCLCAVVEETHDIEHFKAVMQQIFIQELGEDLRRKLESISNEGVVLNKTNEEINAMVQARLNPQEKQRMKNAFEAIVGPAKKMANQRVKGQKMTRSSQFKAKTASASTPKPKKAETNKSRVPNRDRTQQKKKIEL